MTTEEAYAAWLESVNRLGAFMRDEFRDVMNRLTPVLHQFFVHAGMITPNARRRAAKRRARLSTQKQLKTK
ncbi:MAG: hypothetical protein ACXWP0_01310 [Ktedonobacterales bacterium]